MAKIILATSGSFGDLHPYLAVGIALKSRGHDVTVATSQFYREKVVGEGLSFAAMRPDYVPMAGPGDIVRRAFDPYTGARFLLRELVLPFVDETYSDLLQACDGADLLLIHPTLFPAPLVAEKLDLKWISVVLSPGVFVSAYDPPILPPLPWMHALRHLGPMPHKLLLNAMKVLTRSWMKPIDRLRKRERLRPSGRSAMHDDMFSPFGTLAWYSHLLGEAQRDWPTQTCIAGFPFYDRKYGSSMDPELAAFLAAGDPPVVFTLGSSAVVDAGDFFRESLAAVRILGCRAVFLVGDDSDLLRASDESVFVTSYAAFSTLFPEAAAIVHQGGIGTCGQALRAGVPSLIVPLGLDQPDNAFRIHRLGVARILPRRSYTAEAAAGHLRKLLGTPKYRNAAERISAEVRGEDAVGVTCDFVEAICGTATTIEKKSSAHEWETVSGTKA